MKKSIDIYNLKVLCKKFESQKPQPISIQALLLWLRARITQKTIRHVYNNDVIIPFLLESSR